jgi:PBP1b-binding outer membrane lipoprotein LpoB
MRTIGYLLALSLLVAACGENTQKTEEPSPSQENNIDPALAERINVAKVEMLEVSQGLGEMYERLSTYMSENEASFNENDYKRFEPLLVQIEQMKERTDNYYSQLENGTDITAENLKRMEYFSEVIFLKLYRTSVEFKAKSGQHLLSEDDWSEAREYMINNKMEFDQDASYE